MKRKDKEKTTCDCARRHRQGLLRYYYSVQRNGTPQQMGQNILHGQTNTNLSYWWFWMIDTFTKKQQTKQCIWDMGRKLKIHTFLYLKSLYYASCSFWKRSQKWSFGDTSFTTRTRSPKLGRPSFLVFQSAIWNLYPLCENFQRIRGNFVWDEMLYLASGGLNLGKNQLLYRKFSKGRRRNDSRSFSLVIPLLPDDIKE
jgi:hypothetical protein